MPRKASSLGKYVILGGFVLLAVAATVSVFGSDIRQLFATNTDALAGGHCPLPRARTCKNMKNFGTSGDIAGGGYERTTNGNTYQPTGINPTITASEDRFSTFAIDVDTASYTLARRQLVEGLLPAPDGVRVEEFVNAFSYDYPAPEKQPIAVHLDAAPSPFDAKKTLLRVGLQARRIPLSERKNAHLVFLVDVSGSMSSPDRLPLAKQSLHLLVNGLRDGDTVALVTYAGRVAEVLPPTGLAEAARIHEAIDSLSTEGSTAMGDGLALAYRLAARSLTPDSISRVIVMSDGDANVGPTSQEGLRKIIAGHVSEGVTLTTCGFGMGNYRDDLMERLADSGNGASYYIDSFSAARKLFSEQLAGTLELVAQDVKVQVEFDPAAVRNYRLVGYENRAIADRDFRNDKVDAGEIGSGHSVTALYELELTGRASPHLATARVRAKAPRGTTAEEAAFELASSEIERSFTAASGDFRFAVAVAGFAELLRHGPWEHTTSFGELDRLARDAAHTPERMEFLSLVERARALQPRLASAAP